MVNIRNLVVARFVALISEYACTATSARLEDKIFGAPSFKLQAPLTTEQGYCRMFLNMKDNKKQKKTTRKKKDNSKKGDYFLFCRCCTSAIAPDWRSVRDTRYCKDCL